MSERPGPAVPVPPAFEEIELAAGSRVVCDLHLDVAVAGSTERFEAWLGGLRDVPRVIILGDLFEYWVGRAQAVTEGGRRVLAALARTVRGGTAVDVVPGNRDFLLDQSFERETGCRVRRSGLVGRLAGGRRVLLIHGDELCTLDRPYQRLRRVLRSAPMRWLARSLPLAISRALAERLRKSSRRAVAAKLDGTTAMQADACLLWAAAAGADEVVCGHAHSFRAEEPEPGLRWLILDAFGGKRDSLVVEADGGLRPDGTRQAG